MPAYKALVAICRERSGNCCEGSPHYPDCRAANGQTHPDTGSVVVLTTGHLNHDPTDNRPENARYWCQRCHISYDKTPEQRQIRDAVLARLLAMTSDTR